MEDQTKSQDTHHDSKKPRWADSPVLSEHWLDDLHEDIEELDRILKKLFRELDRCR